MGLRFRKSIKVAPGVKVNLNKKSTSITFGGKGVHKTISSTGKKTSSVGIPGTGMYYTSSSGSRSNKHSSAKQLHESNNNIGENIPQQASAPNASLEKFSTDSLQHYKTIFLVLSIIAYLLTVMCFFNSSFLFGFFLLLVGLFFNRTYKTYSGEISNRLILIKKTLPRKILRPKKLLQLNQLLFLLIHPLFMISIQKSLLIWQLIQQTETSIN